MKNIRIYYLLLICILVLFSCEKDQEAMLTQLRVVKEQFTPSYTSIVVECQLSTSASINDVYVQYTTSQDFADYQEEEMQKKDGKYTVNLSNLEDNTTYYIRYAASNRYSTATTKDFSTAKTLAPNHPSVDVVSITDVLDKSANVQFDLTFDGGASVTELGVCYGTSNNPSVDNDKKIAAKDNQTTISLTSLQENTTYYVRAYAKNKVGIAYSESITFTTLTLPKVQTNDISNIQFTSATLNAVLLSNGNDSAVTKGFCWSEISNPTITSSHTEVQNTTSSFSYQLSNLKAETKYYVRAYAKNRLGVVYGAEKTFTTLSATKPVVSTTTVSSITYTSAKTGGNVTSDGGATVTDRGICYSTSSNPTISNSKMSSGSSTGSFTTNLTGLSDGTTYYIRAYATNKKGTSYGEQRSFTTNAYGKPTVTTTAVSNITYTSATVDCNVTLDGGTTVIERGIVYSTSQNPTISNSKVEAGSGVGTFNCELEDLYDNTTYYVRAYATNNEGTSYGQQLNITTLPLPCENGYKYVDLGLSVKWATCNVGATKQEEFGDYFYWGQVKPYEEGYESWTSYPFHLSLSEDAAYMNWGGEWRMPTKDELNELINLCTWKWTTQNGIEGYKVISKSNKNSIFLPLAGYRYRNPLYDDYTSGCYLSNQYNPNVAGNKMHVLYFTNTTSVSISGSSRWYAHSIRPVCP